MTAKAIVLTAIALACFAGNSLLCRLALAEGHVDATTFTAIRLGSGAIVLAVLARGRPRTATASSSWISAGALFAYAAPFSYAYLALGAAMGALLLFASVQVTMLAWGVLRGERPTVLAWLGIAVAIAGLVGLTVPGMSAPDPLGALGMAIAGVAWGVYSLRGRVAGGDPLVLTSASFSRSLLFAGALAAIVLPVFGGHATLRGAILAAASGALASGIGYSVWYSALRFLTATRAAVLQLLVPVLAAGGAVVLLGEVVSTRLALASAAILGGVGLTILARSAPRASASRSRRRAPARRSRRRS